MIAKIQVLPSLVKWRVMSIQSFFVRWCGVFTLLVLGGLWMSDTYAYVGWDVVFSSTPTGLAIGRYLMALWLLVAAVFVSVVTTCLVDRSMVMLADGPSVNVRPFVLALSGWTIATFGTILLVRTVLLTHGLDAMWFVQLVAVGIICNSVWLGYTIYKLPGRLCAQLAVG